MLAAFGTWGGWAALTAIGTVGAVLVAVGQQWWSHRKERSARPRLTLQFDAHKRANEVGPDGTLIPYLRMAVTNAPGKETAADVEILILDVQEFGTGPVGSGGRQVWLANPALGWANSLDPVPRMTIPPGATRYVDVGRWLHDIPLSFVLRVVPEPGSARHILTPGGWRVRLAVTVRNGDATFWEAELSYGEQVQQGLGLPVEVRATVKQVASANA